MISLDLKTGSHTCQSNKNTSEPVLFRWPELLGVLIPRRILKLTHQRAAPEGPEPVIHVCHVLLWCRLGHSVALRVTHRSLLVDNPVAGTESWHLHALQRSPSDRPVHHQLSTACPSHRPIHRRPAVGQQRQPLVQSRHVNKTSLLKRFRPHRCNLLLPMSMAD